MAALHVAREAVADAAWSVDDLRDSALVVATSIMLFIGWDMWWALTAMNVALGGAAMFIFHAMPHPPVNRRIPLAGSRFSPLPGEVVRTGAVGVARTESGVAMGASGTVSLH